MKVPQPQLLSLAIGVCALAPALSAVVLWDNDGNGSTPGDWATALNWSADAVPAANADIVLDDTYVSAAQTIDVGVGVTRAIRSLTFDAPFAYTLDNGTLQLGDGGLGGFVGISVTGTEGAAAPTINSALALVSAATLRNQSSDTLALTGAIDTGANTLVIDGTGDTTVSGVISGAGALAKNGAGVLTLSGANTYTGATTIAGGTLRLGASDRLANSTALTLAGGKLDLATRSDRVGDLAWSTHSTLDFGAPGNANTFLVNGVASASGVLTVHNWTSGSDFFGSFNTGLTAAMLDSIYFSGIGPGASLAGAPTANPGGYTGNAYQITPTATPVSTWIGGANNNEWDRQGGKNWDTSTPAANARVAFGTGPYTTVDLAGSRTVNTITFQDGAAAFTLTGLPGDVLTLSSASATGLAAVMQQSASLQTIETSVTLARDAVIDISGSGNLALTGAITETGGARRLVNVGEGSGKLVLGGTAANTFSGGVFITSGTVEAQKSSALGTGAATVSTGATLELSNNITVANALTTGGSGVGGNGALRNLSGANTLSGNLTLSTDTRLQSDAGTLTVSGGIAGSGHDLAVGGAGNTTLSGAIATGAGGVTKNGAGVLTLSGANTYTGATTINQGTVRLGASDRLADASNVVIAASGTFDLNGFSERVRDLVAAGDGATVDFGPAGSANTLLFDTFTAPASGVLVINNWETGLDHLATTLAGQTGVGSIYFSGLGVAAYNGTATLYGGVRHLLKPVTATEKEWNGSLGDTWNTADNWTSPGKPAANEVARFDAFGVGRPDVVLDGDNTLAGVVFGTGASVDYTVSGASVLTLSGTVPYIQQQSTRTQTLSTATLRLDGNTVADITGSGNLVVDSAITETGGARRLIRDGVGSGKLVLGGTGANTYSGGLFVNTGAVEAQKSSALGTGAATVANGATLELSNNITLANAVTAGGSGVGGNGALRNLSGANTLSGALALSTNTRVQSDSGTLTLSGGITGSGHTLTIGGAGNTTLSGAIATGSGGLVKTDSGALTLSGANTYTGTTSIQQGSVILGASDRLADTGQLALAGGTFDLNGHSEQIGALAVSADSNIDFGATRTDNNFLFSGFASAPSGVISIYNWERGFDYFATTATLTADELAGFYFVGYGSGASQLAAQSIAGYGAGWRPLDAALIEWYNWDGGGGTNRWDTGANWSHPTSDNKTPATNAWASFGAGAVTSVDLRNDRIVNGLRFDVGAASFDIGMGQANTLTLSGPVANSIAFVQQNSANAQSLTMGTLNLARNTVFDLAGAGDLTIASALTGSRNLVKENTGGKLVLSGASTTFSGGIFVNRGVLQITSSGALGNTTGATTVASGATLELNGAGLTTAEAITLGGTGVSGAGAIRNLSGANTLTGNLTLTADTRINADAGTLTLSNTLSGSGFGLTLGGAGNLTVSGVIATGAGTVAKDGAGTLTYSGASANTYTGATTVNAGTLALAKTAGVNAIAGNLVIGDGVGTDTVSLGAADQIADTALVTLNQGGVLALNGHSETLGGLASSVSGSQVQLGSGTLTVNNASAATYAGSLTGTGSFAKTGAGRLTLSGSSGAFSGTTAVNSGMLAIQSADALGTGAVTVANGANLEIQSGITVANAFTIQGDGGAGNEGALENLAGSNTLTGNITLAANARIGSSSGTLTLANSGTLTGANRTLTIGGVGDTVVNRALALGTGGLVKDGGGTLTVNAASTYTGATSLNAGTTRLGVANAFASSTITVATGAILDLNGHNQTIGLLQGGGAGQGGTIEFNGATLMLGAGVSEFGGDFGFSNGTLVINAGVTLTLTDAINAANLNIVLNGGTINLGNGLAHTFGNLLVTAAGTSTIDFGTSGSTVAQFNTVDISGAGNLSVTNWIDLVDYFLAANTPGAQGAAPTNQIVFAGFSGNDTKWLPFSGNGQITPVPEPSSYGALLLGFSAGCYLCRRRR